MNTRNASSPQEQVNALTVHTPTGLHEYIMKQKDAVARVAPSRLNVERAIQIAWGMVRANKYLLKCAESPEGQRSIVTAIMEASQLNLQLDGVLGHAYMVPRRQKGTWQAQMQLGYRGLINLAHRGGALQGVDARVVKENDFFDYEFGTEGFIRHKKAAKERGETAFAYVTIKLEGGVTDFEVWTAEDIDANRNQSDSYKRSQHSPWHTHYDEMAKKAVTRNKLKYAPMEAEELHAVVRDEYREMGLATETTIDIEAELAASEGGES